MKQLKFETYKGYELHYYKSFSNNIVTIFGYAYELGKIKNKANYKFSSINKNKTFASLSLKQQINNNTETINDEKLFNILSNDFSNILSIDKNNDLYIIHIEDFDWLKRTIKKRYGINLKLEENKIKWEN